jgi:uncharacterized membrane protein
MSSIPTHEGIRRFQARQRIVLHWLAAPGVVSGALLVCSVALHWQPWLAYMLFIIFLCVLLLILAMRRCPFCRKTVSLGIASGWSPRAELCPHCLKSLCDAAAE